MTCDWPGCDLPALCASGNYGGRLVCSQHFLITNGNPTDWTWHHDHLAELIARDGWMCEEHPGREWPHDDCSGPGMAWSVEGRANIEALMRKEPS